MLLCLFIIWAVVGSCCGAGDFVKDQALDDHKFPPKLEPARGGIPAGHLRPLGFQRLSDGKIKQFNSVVYKVFFEKWVTKRQPAHLTPEHYAPPARTLWGDKYLAANFAKEQMDIYVKIVKNSSHSHLHMINFVKKYHYQEWHIDSPLPEAMKQDLTLPPMLQCPAFRDNLVSVHHTLQSGPTNQGLFSDREDKFTCLLEGRADVILYAPKFNTSFDMEPVNGEGSGVLRSRLNPDMINMFESADVGKATWKWATLRPGDCLYVPADWLIHSRMYGRSQSVYFKMAPLPEYADDCSGLGKADPDLKLADAHFLWHFLDGKWVASASSWTSESVLPYLRALLGRRAEIPFPDFVHFFNWALGLPLDETFKAMDAWKELGDAGMQGFVSREAFESLLWKKAWLAKQMETERKGLTTKDEL